MTTKTIKKISFTIVLTLLFFSSAFASETRNTANEYDSMYRYNAIENNSLSPNLLVNNTEGLKEKPLTKDDETTSDITKQLEDITLKQNFSTETIDNTINAIKKRGGLKTLLIGSNLGVLEFQKVQINNMIFRLNDLTLKTENSTNKIQQIDSIDSQIKSLKEEQTKVDNFILKQNKKFNLFGWLVTSL